MDNKTKKATGEQEKPLNLLIQKARTLPEPDNEYAGKTSSAATTPDNVLFFHRRQLRATDRFINIHHRHVLICCLETAGTVIIDEHTISLKPAHSILIFPLQFHHYIIPQQTINWLYITFELTDNSWLQSLENRIVPIKIFGTDILTDLVAEWRNSSEESGWCPETVRTGVGYFLAKQVEAAHQEPADGKVDQSEHEEGGEDHSLAQAAQLMQQINKYVHDNISNDLRIQTIAEQINKSASHLRVLVRNQIGMGLGLYIRRVRVNHAQWLLINTDSPIDYISERCGFSSPQTFSRSFRHLVGIPPSQFRRKYKFIQ